MDQTSHSAHLLSAFSWPPTATLDLATPELAECHLAVGKPCPGGIAGGAQGSAPELQAEFSLDAMLQNIVNSSAIEGENLNVQSVRSSLARRLGL